jgi:hypothetical protein
MNTKPNPFRLDKEELDRRREENERREREEQERKKQTKRNGEKPAHTFHENLIDFRIFENKKAGRPDWKIEFVRLYTYGERQGEAKSYRLGDVADLVRGLYRARRWIRREEYHRDLRSWWRSW